MSTRSTTHFVHNFADKKPSAIVYRHYDGYPEGAGVDLHKFLDRCAGLQDSRFTDPTYLAAKYVVFLAEEFADDKKEPLAFLGVGVCQEDPGDIEYRYVVICDGKGPNGRPTVKCFKLGRWDTGVDVEVPIELKPTSIEPQV